MTTYTTTCEVDRFLPADGLWNRAFAAAYPAIMSLAEAGGIRAAREDVVSQARGRTLEVGAGMGHSLPFYGESVTDLVLTEPDVWMLGRLERRAAESGRRATIRRAAAEELPVADASIDSVVCNLVLCTVRDPDRVLREIARVLRPQGQLLFIEHVLADTQGWAWVQRRLRRAWSRFACGCQLTRETLAVLERSPLEVVEAERTRLRTVPFVHSYISGRAIRPA
jgi:ubiquinone/menaquinone biosynthesis C-methylase UbiE